MPRISGRAVAVLSASVVVGAACGLALSPALHARPQARADGPTPMERNPDFGKPGRAMHSIGVAFPTATAKTPAGAVILDRDADGRVVLDIKRQGCNNLQEDRTHRALVQFFPAVPRGQIPRGADLLPLHEFELPAKTLRAGGLDNFNDASRRTFAVPPGDYSLLVVTAGPSGPNLPQEERLIEKDPKGFWTSSSARRYPVSVR